MQGGFTPPDAAASDGPSRGPSVDAEALPGDRNGGRGDTPPIDESVRRIADAGSALAGSAVGTFKAFRALVVADLALSRSAAGRVLVLAAVGTALGASAWLFGMVLLVLVLRSFGLDWWIAVAVPTLLSMLGSAACAWFALRAFELTRFQATRRQLAKIGIGDDPAQVDRDPERMA